ncbi:hypothetical protein [Streptacidiphilus sp. EB103A]|uniref:hypothetical protein n=1 Tax=Streptacidiphilus sp. EB103A TaxID=3156275 RepID=UPI003514B4E4
MPGSYAAGSWEARTQEDPSCPLRAIRRMLAAPVGAPPGRRQSERHAMTYPSATVAPKVVLITGASSGVGDATAAAQDRYGRVDVLVSRPADVDVNELVVRPTAQG